MNLLKSEHRSTRNLRSTPSFARRHTRLERVSIVPGHPIWRVPEQFSAVSLQLCQVIERVSAAELAGIDETHEQIAHAGAVLGLIEHGVLSMKNSHLQRSPDDVIVQPCSSLSSEQ